VRNTFQVQVVRRGIITLPKELRDNNQIEEGDLLTLINLGDGIVVMSPRRSRVEEIADRLAKEWQSSGETLESMLTTLREVREADEVVRRKAPHSLPLLAQLLAAGRVKTAPKPSLKQNETAQAYVQYPPDAHVLAEAMAAQPGWFIPHDKEHFLNQRTDWQPGFVIDTPGELIQTIKDGYRSSSIRRQV